MKKCVEVGLLSSAIFNNPLSVRNLNNPITVGITQFVLDHATDTSPSKVMQMAKLFDGFGYCNLASSVTGEDMSISRCNHRCLSCLCAIVHLCRVCQSVGANEEPSKWLAQYVHFSRNTEHYSQIAEIKWHLRKTAWYVLHTVNCEVLHLPSVLYEIML